MAVKSLGNERSARRQMAVNMLSGVCVFTLNLCVSFFLTPEDAKRFENIMIPAHTYVVCETERCVYPTTVFEKLRKKIVEEWLPSSGYMLAEAPEVSVTHWFRKPDNEKRYIELWLPVSRMDG